MFKKGLTIALSAVLLAAMIAVTGTTASAGGKITLKFAHPYSPMHPQHKGVLVPWAKTIEEQTGGKVKIKFFTGGALGKPGQTIDVLEKHIADIGWDICDYSPGRFPLTTVVELPFMLDTAEQGAVALWKTYEKEAAMQKEWDKVHLLAIAGHTPGVFASKKKPIMSMDDLGGMKIKTASAFTTDALKLFGAVPVVQPVTETYTSLERGVVDAVVMPFDGMVIFKIHELVKYYTPANFYTVVFWTAMDKKKYASLPEDVKKVIDANSGMALSQKFGTSFDETFIAGKKTIDDKGIEAVEFPPAEKEKLVGITEQLKDKWIEDMNSKGLPGKQVLDTATTYLKESMNP